MKTVYLIVIIVWLNQIADSKITNIIHSNNNTNRVNLQPHELVKNREKRFLIFNNGGIAKIVLGFMSLLDFHPTHPSGTLICLYNFQAQYSLPADVSSFFSKFKSRTLSERYARNLENDGDQSRQFAYEVVESFLNKRNRGKINGKNCLLKAICEMGSSNLRHHNGLIGEVIEIFLTPGLTEQVDQIYKDARLLGENGGDCDLNYIKCKYGDGLLDSVSLYENELANFIQT